MHTVIPARIIEAHQHTGVLEMRYTHQQHQAAAVIEYSQVEMAASPAQVQFVDFGVVDAKGRAMGARLSLWSRTYTEIDRPVVTHRFTNRDGSVGSYEVHGTSREVTRGFGLFYVFCPHATRDGKPYGAAQHAKEFATEAERDSAVAKYLKSAKARAK